MPAWWPRALPTFWVQPEGFALLGVPALGVDGLVRVGILATLCALLSMAFCALMHHSGRWYRKWFPNPYLRVTVGAALVLALTALEGSGDYNGAGSGVLEHALQGYVSVPWAFLLKIPTFFVGATFGCAVAPLLGLDPAFGAAIGLVSLFCGVVNCPLSSIFLSVELFGGGLLYFALSCSLSFLLSGKFSLYSAQKLVYSKLEPRYIDAFTK